MTINPIVGTWANDAGTFTFDAHGEGSVKNQGPLTVSYDPATDVVEARSADGSSARQSTVVIGDKLVFDPLRKQGEGLGFSLYTGSYAKTDSNGQQTVVPQMLIINEKRGSYFLLCGGDPASVTGTVIKNADGSFRLSDGMGVSVDANTVASTNMIYNRVR